VKPVIKVKPETINPTPMSFDPKIHVDPTDAKPHAITVKPEINVNPATLPKEPALRPHVIVDSASIPAP